MIAKMRRWLGVDARYELDAPNAPTGMEGDRPGQVIGDWLEQYIRDRESIRAKARPEELAAVAASASLVGRAFSLADVQPKQQGLTAGLLGLVGRELVYRGESVLVIDVSPVDGLTLTPSSSYDITGGWQPATWRYRCDRQGPSRVITSRREYAEVIHARINVDSKRPWRGQAPWKAASLTANLAARVELGLTQEVAIPPSRIAPYPAPSAEQMAAYQGQLARGGLHVLATADSITDTAMPNSTSIEPRRIGAEPAQALVELREQTTAEIMAACGCPMELFHGSEGAASREALRRWLHSTILPWAEVVAAELSEKLERDISLSFDRLMASDLSGRARAFQSMVHGGMDLAQAAALAGLMEAAE